MRLGYGLITARARRIYPSIEAALLAAAVGPVRSDASGVRRKRRDGGRQAGSAGGGRAAGLAAGFRLLHFSVQRNHLHLIVEARDKQALSRGLQGTAIRVARAYNRATGHSGKVFADRYHAHTLRTPSEVRRAIAYVLGNGRKHREWIGIGPDPCSSGRWFDGWKAEAVAGSTGSPLPEPRSWLLHTGWRRRGLIALDELPRPGPIFDRFIEPLAEA